MAQLKLKARFQLEIVDDETIFLISETETHLARGRHYRFVAPLLDGSRDEDQLIEALKGRLSPPETLYALASMKSSGWIESQPSAALPNRTAAFWQQLGLEAGSAEQALAGSGFQVHAIEPIEKEPFSAALEAMGMTARDQADIVVTVADDYLRPELAEWNRRAIAHGQPWLLVKPAGVHPWIGPLFVPGQTGCWLCLADRLRANRAVERFLREREPERREPLFTAPAMSPANAPLTARLAAIEAARWAAGGSSRLEGRILRLKLDEMASDAHALTRRPQCPACGEPHYRTPLAPRPIEPASRPKNPAADGGSRQFTPEDTYAAFHRHISPITGLTRAVQRIPGQSRGVIHNFQSGHNLAVDDDAFSFLDLQFRHASMGKGRTETQSKTSALCEALERVSGVHQGYEPRVRASLRELGEDGIDPNACLLFSEAQIERRRQKGVAAPFDPEAALQWAPLWSLTARRFRYLPMQYCYYGYPLDGEARHCKADSNGAAAGRSREEAIVQGVLELLERDAVAIWWYNRIRRPRVDLASFQDPYVDALVAEYRQRGRDLWALDITADFGVPVYAAVSTRQRDGGEITLGFGCHPDAGVALSRALTEANQFLPVIEARARDSGYEVSEPAARNWLDNANLANQPHLAPDPEPPASGPRDNPLPQRADLADDLERLVALVAERGMETLVLDQTRPDIGLSVVKAVIPGLRHFWRRLAPGRLYDVPTALGWRDAPLREDQLNPIPIFF